MEQVKVISGSVTKRGQVNLPSAVRRHLGIDAPGKILFEVSTSGVRLRRPEYTVDDVFGILPPLPEGMSLEEAIELAKEEHAAHVAQEGL